MSLVDKEVSVISPRSLPPPQVNDKYSFTAGWTDRWPREMETRVGGSLVGPWWVRGGQPELHSLKCFCLEKVLGALQNGKNIAGGRHGK